MNLEASNESLYNNADSFAMAFDAAWKECVLESHQDLDKEEKIQISFKKINTHPFLIKNPAQAKEIALFRIKLLGLS
tara:strand:- start:545 stop:775 length:231 start_codon:yes stop_codon:yes gene_type:complete